MFCCGFVLFALTQLHTSEKLAVPCNISLHANVLRCRCQQIVLLQCFMWFIWIRWQYIVWRQWLVGLVLNKRNVRGRHIMAINLVNFIRSRASLNNGKAQFVAKMTTTKYESRKKNQNATRENTHKDRMNWIAKFIWTIDMARSFLVEMQRVHCALWSCKKQLFVNIRNIVLV